MFMPTATGGPANQQDGPQCDLQELNSFLPELAGLSVQTKRRLNKSISQEEGKKWSPRLPPPPPAPAQKRAPTDPRERAFAPVSPRAPPALCSGVLCNAHTRAGSAALRAAGQTGAGSGPGPAGLRGGAGAPPPPRPGSAAPAPASAAATWLATHSPALWRKGQPRGRRPVSPGRGGGGGGSKGTPTANASEINKLVRSRSTQGVKWHFCIS